MVPNIVTDKPTILYTNIFKEGGVKVVYLFMGES